MTKKEFLFVEVYASEWPSIIKCLYLKYVNSSTNAVYLLRKMMFARSCIGKAYYRHRLELKYGIFVGENAVIGLGLKLPHPNGIIVGNSVSIGNGCTLYQQTTIGSRRSGDTAKGLQPVLGDSCTVFSGAKVIGDIVLGNGTVVGANAVLSISTPAFSTCVGVPAKIITK